MATLKDVKTGKKEILPSTAKDKNGKKQHMLDTAAGPPDGASLF